MMKKYFLMAFALMLTFSLSMSAQNRQGRQRMNNDNHRQEMRMTAQDRAEWMAKELDLNDAQKAEVLALFEKQDVKRSEQMSKMREQRDRSTVNRDEMRSLREKEMKANQAELEKIIGKEKMEKLSELQKTRRESNRSGRNR